VARQRDWEAERGRQLLAATYGSTTGEGSRPAPASPAPASLPTIVVSVRLSEADKKRLNGRDTQVAKAMPHLRSARLAVIAKEKRAARQQTQLAWSLLRPVVVALRRSGSPEDRRLAARLVKPVRALLSHAVKLELPDLDAPAARQPSTRERSTGKSAPPRPTPPPQGPATQEREGSAGRLPELLPRVVLGRGRTRPQAPRRLLTQPRAVVRGQARRWLLPPGPGLGPSRARQPVALAPATDPNIVRSTWTERWTEGSAHIPPS
jgi:hypothetical protein